MAKKVFSSVLNAPAAAPAAPSALAPRKVTAAGRPSNSPRGEKQVLFHIDDDLQEPLRLEVARRNYEQSNSGSSNREVINDALRLLLKVPKPA